MKKFFFLALLSVLFLAVACPKHDTSPKPEELPPMTQTGANTFGCLLNGKVWLPNWGGGYWPVDAQYYRGEFSIITSRIMTDNNKDRSVWQNIHWNCKPVYDTGLYYLKSDSSLGLGAFFDDNILNHFYSISYKDSLKNWLHISKLDTANKERIIAGTFNLFFTAAGLDTLSITSGRFDVKYTY